jgi:hypothetical protein
LIRILKTEIENSMKNIWFVVLLIFPFRVFGQTAKDTVIDDVKYHYVSYYFNGKIKTISQKKTKTEEGEWIYFDRSGEEERRGAFDDKGEKTGSWWYKKHEITYYEKGKVVGKGSGCIGCGSF